MLIINRSTAESEVEVSNFNWSGIGWNKITESYQSRLKVKIEVKFELQFQRVKLEINKMSHVRFSNTKFILRNMKKCKRFPVVTKNN